MVCEVKQRWLWKNALAIGLVLILSSGVRAFQDEETEEPIDDISGHYQFVAAGDRLAILEEEGKLKGYIDVVQGDDESDAVLSYTITRGSRKKDKVEFKTNKIHQKYYRFSGTVRRGTGHETRDPDYLRLIGGLEIVTVKGETGEESVQRMHYTFKSRGRMNEDDQQGSNKL